MLHVDNLAQKVILFSICACRNVVMTALQAYRVVVLPVANTWMSWSLLHKMSITPSGPLIALLGIVLLACILMGLQVGAGLWDYPLALHHTLWCWMHYVGVPAGSVTLLVCPGSLQAARATL